MSVLQKIKGALFSPSDSTDGLEQLRELLAEREAELTLEARYGEPFPDLQDEPTVVFPYTTYTGDGERYSVGRKEFVLPDDGLDDAEAALTKFIGKRHGIGPDEVDFEALANVEGTTANAELNENGDVEVA